MTLAHSGAQRYSMVTISSPRYDYLLQTLLGV